MDSDLFEVALLAVAVGHGKAAAHESGSGNQQQKDAFIDRALPALGAGFDVARTHCATLAESGRDHTREAERKEQCQKCNPNFHFTSSIVQPGFQFAVDYFTPSVIIRSASGKKKMVIKIRHAT